MTYASWNINEFKIVLVENGFKRSSDKLVFRILYKLLWIWGCKVLL